MSANIVQLPGFRFEVLGERAGEGGYSCFPDPSPCPSPHPFRDARSAEEKAVNGRGEGTELKSGERSLSTPKNLNCQ